MCGCLAAAAGFATAREQLFALRFAGMRSAGERHARRRQALALRCLRLLAPTDAEGGPAVLRQWLSELQAGLEGNASAEQHGDSSEGPIVVRGAVVAAAASTATVVPAPPPPPPAGPASSVETQTPTGLVQLLLADTFAVPQPPAPTVTVATETAEMQTQTLLLDHHAAAADAAPAPQSGGSAAAVAAATAWGEEAGTQTGAFANDVMMISIETQSDLEEGIFSSQHSAPSFHSAGTSPLRCNGDELEALDF
eukprot:COSAG01_NODE_3267_length_6330_cov_133.385331_6_plen_252_part_00